jgi:glycosyltransferase involved in cell wall biosynthesis
LAFVGDQGKGILRGNFAPWLFLGATACLLISSRAWIDGFGAAPLFNALVAMRWPAADESPHLTRGMNGMASKRLRIGFIVEQALGHVTHAQNLRNWVDRDGDIDSTWLWVPHRASDVWERLPWLPFSMKLSLRARRVVRQTLARQPLDCLYFHTQALALFSLDLMKVLPAVISLDATPEGFKSIATAYDANPSSGFVNSVKHAWHRAALRRAAGLVAISDWVKDSLLQHYGVPPEKVRVIRFAVDVGQWQPIAKAGAANRPLRLLFVGGDFARKGGDVLLSAFRRGLSETCELDIVTRDPVNATEHAVRIHSDLSPNDPRLRQLFAQADLFVLPTQGDASPVAVLEAMASGLPVIATNIGAMSELVQEGVTGFLVPVGDPNAIVDRVASLARRPEQLAEMGRAARLAVERKFSAETIYKGLIDYLKEVGRSSGARAAGTRWHG